jgi:hypothetical protein
MDNISEALGCADPDTVYQCSIHTGPGGAYTGRMLIDGVIYTPREATKKFFQR